MEPNNVNPTEANEVQNDKFAFLNKIPEFSEKNFVLATRICAGVLGVVSLWFIWEMLTFPDFGFDVEWNMFNSILITPLYAIGLICAIVKWGAWGHWGRTPVINTYKNGSLVKTEEDNDITSFLLWQVLFPILGHFVIEPLAYAAVIYYPLMCVAAVLSALLPYMLTVILLALAICLGVFGARLLEVKCHSLLVVALTVLLSIGLIWWAAYLHGENVYNAPAPAPAEEEVVLEPEVAEPVVEIVEVVDVVPAEELVATDTLAATEE